MTILDEAKELVLGERGQTYGHPINDFTCTANMWTAYIRRKHGAMIQLYPEDVAMMMLLVKVSREANKYKRDNLVDMAGYALTCEMIHETYAVPPPTDESAGTPEKTVPHDVLGDM